MHVSGNIFLFAECNIPPIKQIAHSFANSLSLTCMPIGIQVEGKFVSLPAAQRDHLLELWSFTVSLFKTPLFPDKKLHLESVEAILRGENSTEPSSCRFFFDEFWRCVGADDPDTLLLRFLVARKCNVAEAFRMLANCLVWRGSEFGVHSLMLTGESGIKRSLLQKGQVCFRGVDNENRLLVHIDVGLHSKNGQTPQEMNQYVIYMIEVGRTLMPAGTETFTIVFDMSKFSFASIDMPGIYFVISCLSNYYPESLGCCLIVNAPLVFHGVFKVIKAWLDAGIVAKIRFIKQKELGLYIPADYLKDIQASCSFEYSEPEGPFDAASCAERELELVNERDLAVGRFLEQNEWLQETDGFDLGEILIARQTEIQNIRRIGRQILEECRERHHWQRVGFLAGE